MGGLKQLPEQVLASLSLRLSLTLSIFRFDDTWLFEYDQTLCKVKDCYVKIDKDLIRHFVWFENTQISADFNTTPNCFEPRKFRLSTIPIEKIILPLEFIWFEEETFKVEPTERIWPPEWMNYTETQDDEFDIEETERSSNRFHLFYGTQG